MTAERYSVFELQLRVESPVAKNPFTDVTVTGQFTHSGADSLSVKGFCDSPEGLLFRVRFCPQEVGEYSFLVTYFDREGSEEFPGSFTSNEAGRKGFIRVDPEYPNHFMYENSGHPFICSKTAWVIGDTVNWRGFLDKMVPRKENCIRFGVETDYYHETVGKDVWPWGGTRSNPDFSRFNPAVWQKLEQIIIHAAERGILSEPVIFCSLRREDPTAPDPAMEPYWDYLIARLSPFTSIITWQLYNEYASAKSYQQYMAEYIRQHDPYNHFICSSAGTTNDALWPTEPWMDIAINHSCTDDSQLEAHYHAIATRIHGYGKPAWCDETGRENRHGNNSGIHRRKQYWTWNICGDYWSYHSWEGCEGIEDLAYNGPGSEFLQFIRPFWEKTEWWRMQPADERILNDPLPQYEWCLASDTETVVYMVNEAEGASTKEGTIELAVGAGPYSAVFYSPASGTYLEKYQRSGYHTGGKLVLGHPAFVDDLVLYVKHAQAPPPREVSLTFTPIADSWADALRPNSNYGSNPDLHVGGGDPLGIAYLKFDVHGIEGDILSAILTLTCMSPSSQTGGRIYLTSSDWREDTLTWNNRPGISGKSPDSLGPVSAGAAYDLDVSYILLANDVLSFALTSEAQDGAGYDSREANSPPLLKVRFAPTPQGIIGVRHATSRLVICWPGLPGDLYRVQCSPDLVQWGDASSLPDYQPPFYSKNGYWAWPDPSWTTIPMRFYRAGR